MELEIKEKIKPLYGQLQGILKNTPSFKDLEKQAGRIMDESIWKDFNVIIDKLNQIVKEVHADRDYSDFKIILIKKDVYERPYIDITKYKITLGGLIEKLYFEYFKDEERPFSETPSTVMNQIQEQSQNQIQQNYVQMILEIQSKIDKKLLEIDKEKPEHKFLQKVKDSLSQIKNVSQLINLIIKTARELGLSLDKIENLFN